MRAEGRKLHRIRSGGGLRDVSRIGDSIVDSVGDSIAAVELGVRSRPRQHGSANTHPLDMDVLQMPPPSYRGARQHPLSPPNRAALFVLMSAHEMPYIAKLLCLKRPYCNKDTIKSIQLNRYRIAPVSGVPANVMVHSYGITNTAQASNFQRGPHPGLLLLHDSLHQSRQRVHGALKTKRRHTHKPIPQQPSPTTT